ncbi:MAG TPA: type II secretion system protein [Candidatus Dormibacteraeota bacterium]|nr:type II secretion system protein [Candidatus Dormibacteraeota bacterium]
MQGLLAYFSKNLKGKKGQRGFTLIELLVVVTILGVLAAIVTLSLVGITTNAEKQSCLQEYKTVQSGLDAYMAYNDVTTVTAATTQDMSTPVLLYDKNGSPTFIRNSPTLYKYTWDVNGRITAITQGSQTGAPAVPAGCVPSGV